MLCAQVACEILPETKVNIEDKSDFEKLSMENPENQGVANKNQGKNVQSVTTGEKDEIGFYQPGTDRTIKPIQTTSPTVKMVVEPGAVNQGEGISGNITLNFENTPINEVVKIILGDLLNANYLINPSVQGAVSLQSSQPLTRDDLLPTLETLLRMNNAALIRVNDVYQVIPREGAILGNLTPQLGDLQTPLPNGYTLQIVPLKFISVGEMQKILEPIVLPGTIVRVDSTRNIMLLSGPSVELETVMDTVSIFDVDWMKGMSIALFTPQYVDAKTLSSELELALGGGDKELVSGLIKFIPLERLNALMAISPRRAYLKRARDWVERLDKSSGGVGKKLFVYNVQNGKAADLADVLSKALPESTSDSNLPAPEIAPNLAPVELRSPEISGGGDPNIPPPPIPTNIGGVEPAAAPGGSQGGISIDRLNDIRIIADEVNNALLILSTSDQFRLIEEALRQLDVVPLQVLVEVTIAEINLTDDLSQGVEWYFKNSVDNKSGVGVLDLVGSGSPGLSAIAPGFSYALTDAAGIVRTAVNAFVQESKAKIVATPSLMVLNNQTASIEVGDQVPIFTQQQQDTVGNSNIVNNIEYRDTGVIFNVTPRVNAGGLVTMELDQDVSTVQQTDSATGNPTIRQRRISSTVAVQSGETIVIGGLIREDDSRVESGLPVLRNIPIIGWFFSRTVDDITRNELIVLITPRAIRGVADGRTVTDEYRKKLEILKDEDNEIRGFGPLFHKVDWKSILDSGETEDVSAE